MNKALYWKIRKRIKTLVFTIKRILYRIKNYFYGERDYSSFLKDTVKFSLLEIIKGFVFVVALRGLDCIIISNTTIPTVSLSVFVPIVIGGIGIAGIILGLYCANMASIYSSRYANAPQRIATAFQNDRLTRKCISSIVGYIVFGFTLLVAVSYREETSLVILATFAIWSVSVVVSYSIAGNRSYQLSDVYGIAEDSHRVLYRIIRNELSDKAFADDENFQNHFFKISENQLELLRTIQEYGTSINKSDNTENAAMTGFMCNNLALVELYWMNKNRLDRSSRWFRDKPSYPKWHFASEVETSIALQIGTTLKAKAEQNYYWFEEELFANNKIGLSKLFSQHDYVSIYKYLLECRKMCRIAIESKEVNYFAGHIDWLKNSIENKAINDYDGTEKQKEYAGVIDLFTLLYLDLILEASNVYQDYDFNKTFKGIIQSIDAGVDVEKCSYLRERQDVDFYKKLITEVQAEGRRLTPDWVIKQQIAREEYNYVNSLIDVIREGIDNIFRLGESFQNKELYFDACIILTRYYEYASKLDRFIGVVSRRKEELSNYQIDKAIKWDSFRMEKLQKTICDWNNKIPDLLSDCSSRFSLDNWNNRDDYPDFLGESYNHICDDAIDAIISNNMIQFSKDFENLSKMMLLYQEYIRTDFIKNKDLYRIEYAYYMFTSPIVEWAQIGGLAILWGEFHSDNKWHECVKHGTETILFEDRGSSDLAEKLIEYVQHRDSFIYGLTSRGILETRWKQNVENAIRQSGKYEIEYERFEQRLKTNSKLLVAFCPHFVETGFMNDPSEVFWVVCINPYLSDEKKYHTQYSWEDRMSE